MPDSIQAKEQQCCLPFHFAPFSESILGNVFCITGFIVQILLLTLLLDKLLERYL